MIKKSQHIFILFFVISHHMGSKPITVASTELDLLQDQEGDEWIKVPSPTMGSPSVNEKDLYGSDEVDIMTWELMDSLKRGV